MQGQLVFILALSGYFFYLAFVLCFYTRQRSITLRVYGLILDSRLVCFDCLCVKVLS